MFASEFKSRADRLREQAEEVEDPDQVSRLFRRSSSLYRKAAEKTENREKASALNQLAEQLETEADNVLHQEPSQDGPDGGYFSEPPEVTFEDVGGMEDVKGRLRDRVISQFRETEFREALGVSPTNGVLLHGPPGTGKTLLSKAVSAELGFPWAEVHTADLVSKYVGESAKQAQELFREALQVQPCVVFLDEIDALASHRGTGLKTDSEGQRVTQLLQSLDRVQGEDVLVMASTNLLDEVDPAIRRSGRFDEVIRVGLPDLEARRKILEVHLRDRAHRVSGGELQELAELTDGFSGSDLAAVVKAAGQQAHLDSIECGELQPISYEYLASAVSHLAESGDSEG